MASQVRNLAPAEVQKAYPVHLHGIVTYYDSVAPNLFVQDSSGGIWVDSTGLENPPKPGDLIDLDGVVGPGFTPVVIRPHWKAIGSRPLPHARRVRFADIASGVYDSQRIELEGIVRSFVLEAAGNVLVIDVATSGGVFKVRIPNYNAPFPMELVDASVRFRGVCGSSFNRQRQLINIHLFLPTLQDITVVQPALAEPFSMSATAIGNLGTFTAKGVDIHRVRVVGVITAQVPGRGMFLKDATGGLYVQTQDGGNVQQGDEVEAVGFPVVGEYTPVLRNARFRPTRRHELLVPAQVSSKEALFGNYDAQLIQIDGILQADRPDRAGGHILVVESNDGVFYASIDKDLATSVWPTFPVGSKLRLTGICLIRTDENGNPSEFRVLLRSPQDIAVLAHPSWFSGTRALSLLGILVLVAIGALIWVLALRRRVLHQTALIRRKIESEAHLEHRYRTLVENAPYGIASLDQNYQLLDVNPAFRQIAEMNGQEISGLRLPDVFKFSPTDLEQFNRLLELGGTFQHVEFISQKQNSAHVILRISGHVISEQSNSSKRVEIILEDITAQRQLEQQLLQNHKIEAVGRLAGGVAHDFNNLLMIISGHVSLLLHKFTRGSAEGAKLEIVEEAANRAAGLTRQLLAYSRKQMLESKVMAADPLVKNLEGMLRRLIREDIELRTELHSKGAHIKVDPNQLEQVLINLAVNARDAMPHGGLLLIKTERVQIQPRSHLASAVAPGSYLLISVSDNGVGMDAATREKLFEPFFTTKELGQGTGLGLSMAYGIVKQSGGHIAVDSAPGQGSTFRLYLPLVEEFVAATPVPDVGLHPLRGRGTILVVEDEKQLRALMAETLTSLGYEVLQAANGAEGLQLAESRLPSIDLLVTDMIMPRMNGRDLCRSLRTRRPGLPVLFISGYSDIIPSEEEFFNATTQLVQKPVSPEVLGRRVRELLLFTCQEKVSRTSAGSRQ